MSMLQRIFARVVTLIVTVGVGVGLAIASFLMPNGVASAWAGGLDDVSQPPDISDIGEVVESSPGDTARLSPLEAIAQGPMNGTSAIDPGMADGGSMGTLDALQPDILQPDIPQIDALQAEATPPAGPSVAQAEVRRGSFVAQAVNRVGPAVVRIDTERTITRSPSPFFQDPFFQQFFGGEMMPPQPYEQRLRGQGSGVILDAEGLILTNAHVVDQADLVTVALKDGRSFEGEVLGADELTDLAVVKITATDIDLPIAPLGDSDAVMVGDWAIAVGNPLGLDNTVTLGIVSTLNRSSVNAGIPDKRLDFIQTDAAINPGNSGGPLLNDAGEVIGINTAIRANANGIGFAIPINKAKEILPQLARGEAIAHPYIGVQIATLTPDLARRNNENPNSSVMLPELNGVLVTGVVPDTPAATSGLRRGDVIVKVDGQAIPEAQNLQELVDRTEVGQSLELEVKRGDRTLTLTVETMAMQSRDR